VGVDWRDVEFFISETRCVKSLKQKNYVFNVHVTKRYRYRQGAVSDQDK